MMKLLEKARAGSYSAKNKLAIILAASITILVVGSWILVIKTKNVEDEAKDNAKSDSLKPLFMLFNKATKDFREIKENITNLRSEPVENNSDTVVE